MGQLALQGADRAEMAGEDMADGDDLALVRLPRVGRSQNSGTPPVHMPFAFDAAILSRIRSPVTSRPNRANDRNTLGVRRPMQLVLLNACVMLTKRTPAERRQKRLLTVRYHSRGCAGCASVCG